MDAPSSVMSSAPTVAAVHRVNRLVGWAVLAAMCALLLLEHLQQAINALVDEVDLASIPVTDEVD